MYGFAVTCLRAIQFQPKGQAVLSSCGAQGKLCRATPLQTGRSYVDSTITGSAGQLSLHPREATKAAQSLICPLTLQPGNCDRHILMFLSEENLLKKSTSAKTGKGPPDSTPICHCGVKCVFMFTQTIDPKWQHFIDKRVWLPRK